ncbi:unnamed protein product, partial [Echinostoma caproni]|uniref:Iwr1 domain-containing protein n=1 Tax=Echinostoma caproni TaxID=27848 RepID=A0A183A3H7_9TREM
PGEGFQDFSPPSTESSYQDIIHYVTGDVDDDDVAFLALTDSTDTESEFGLPLSEFMDFDDEDDEEFDPR